MNRVDSWYIVPVLEEVRVALNLTGKDLKQLIVSKNLLPYLTENYQSMHCFGFSEGLDAVIHIVLDKDSRYCECDLKTESWVNENLVECLDILAVSFELTTEECYLKMLETEQYRWIYSKLGNEHCLSPGAWAVGICRELGWDETKI